MILERLRRLWKLSSEPYNTIGSQAFTEEPEIIYPPELAEKQKATFIPHITRDPIKEITQEQP